MDNILYKLQDENESQYIWRIGQAKDNGLIDSTWDELSNILNTQCGIREEDFRGSSAWRKRYRVMQQAWDDVFSNSQFASARVVGSDDKARELEKERHKLRATNIEARKNLRKESRQELFYENIAYAIKTLPVPEFSNSILSVVGNKNYEYVLTIADLQAGARFNIDCNSYSLEECANRFNILLENVKVFVCENHVRTLHVVELGDTIQNILRISDLQLNETSVVNATVTIARLIAKFLNELSSVCFVEYYHTPTSNHSQIRPIGTKASELASEDIEFIIGNYIQDVLRNNDRINVNLNFGYDHIEIPIFDYNILALHGHTIKNLDTALRDLSAKHRKLIDYVFVGHYHTGKVIPGNAHDGHDTELLMSPSFQGADPYAYNKLGLSSKAACKIFKFDPVHGCTGQEKFILN